MRILEITAGAAGMYCGSCLRDNALAAELKAMGHDVTLLPLYTPTLTDEPNVSDSHVFFGGISVYLQQNHALFRHTPRFLDRLWDSKLALRAASRRSIPVDPRFLGEMTVSMLEGRGGALRKEFEKMADWLRTQPPPGVICLPYTLLIGLAEPLREALARPVACTLQGEDLFLENLPETYQRRALELIRSGVKYVDRFLATSSYCAKKMAEYLAIPRGRIDVVPLGINLSDFAPRVKRHGPPFRIGYLARIAPEKGLHQLCAAFRLLRGQPDAPDCTLEAAGYLAPEHAGYVEKLLRETPGFTYHGAPDRIGKIDFLRSLDVFSVPTVYRETKGIFLLEAMACGVPAVQPEHGSFPEMIEATGGGILVEPGDPGALADGLLRVLSDADLAGELGRRGAEGVARQYPLRKMAERTLQVLERVAGETERARSPRSA